MLIGKMENVIELLVSFLIPLSDLQSIGNLLLTRKSFLKTARDSPSIGKLLCLRKYPSSKLLEMKNYWRYLQGTLKDTRSFADFNIVVVSSNRVLVELQWDEEAKAYVSSKDLFANTNLAKEWWNNQPLIMVLCDAKTNKEICAREGEEQQRGREVKIIFASGSTFLVPMGLEFTLTVEENGVILAKIESEVPIGVGYACEATAPIEGSAMYRMFCDGSFQSCCDAYAIAVDIWGFADDRCTKRLDLFSGILTPNRRKTYFESSKNYSESTVPQEPVTVYGRITLDATIIRIDGAIFTEWRNSPAGSVIQGTHSFKNNDVSSWFDYDFQLDRKDCSDFNNGKFKNIIIPRSCRMIRSVYFMRYDRQSYPTELLAFGADFFGNNWVKECGVAIRNVIKRDDGEECFAGVKIVKHGQQVRFDEGDVSEAFCFRNPDDFFHEDDEVDDFFHEDDEEEEVDEEEEENEDN